MVQETMTIWVKSGKQAGSFPEFGIIGHSH